MYYIDFFVAGLFEMIYTNCTFIMLHYVYFDAHIVIHVIITPVVFITKPTTYQMEMCNLKKMWH